MGLFTPLKDMKEVVYYEISGNAAFIFMTTGIIHYGFTNLFS